MRVGSVVFTTDQGLGILAKSFYDVGVITDVLVIRHGRRPEHNEWYPNARRIGDTAHLVTPDILSWLADIDVMLFFETPFNWELIELCRASGVATALMPMYECMPKEWPAKPDLIINPSKLDQQYYPDGVHIPVPVVGVDWKLRTRACTFIHNAGHGGLRGRNGTKELLLAMQYVKSPIRLIVRSQDRLSFPTNDPRIEFQGHIAASRLWTTGDVFVFPEKFNGLSLPMQEARAAGMLVLATDRFPMNDWLPQEFLVPVSRYDDASVSPRCVDFKEAIVNPVDLAKMIDAVYDIDISAYSRSGLQWAESMSWEVLKPQYVEALKSCLK